MTVIGIANFLYFIWLDLPQPTLHFNSSVSKRLINTSNPPISLIANWLTSVVKSWSFKQAKLTIVAVWLPACKIKNKTINRVWNKVGLPNAARWFDGYFFSVWIKILNSDEFSPLRLPTLNVKKGENNLKLLSGSFERHLNYSLLNWYAFSSSLFN